MSKQTLPKWFNGELYKEGNTAINRFTGEEYKLTAEELSMYDLIMGASIMVEMGMDVDKGIIKDLRKGLEWFKENNSKAYLVLFG